MFIDLHNIKEGIFIVLLQFVRMWFTLSVSCAGLFCCWCAIHVV